MSSEPEEVSLPSIKRAVPLRLRVYEILRKKILNAEFPAGYKLVEEQLADQLGVSRTPVREAIHRLQIEGLVANSDKGNAEVEAITPDSIKQAIEIRKLLETFAARQAAEFISAEQIERLRSLHEQELSLLSEPTAEKMRAINDQIHETIIAASGNQVLLHLVNILSARVPSYRIFGMGSPENFKAFTDSHNRIIEALADGKVETAAREMAAHIDMAYQVFHNFTVDQV